MSAHVANPASPASPGARAPSGDASLWNRLLAVAAAVFAVPVAVELLTPPSATPEAVRLWVALAAAALGAGALWGLFGRARRAPELRLARGLALVLAGQGLLLLALLAA